MVSRAQGGGHLHVHRGKRPACSRRVGRGGRGMTELLSFEKSRPSAGGPRLPEAGVTAPRPAEALPHELLRAKAPALPRLSEPEIMRHYSRLASMNYSISEQFYPLGSCTMKYNPVLNEAVAALPGFAGLHPYQGEETVQAALALMLRLHRALCQLVGLQRVPLHPPPPPPR